MSRLMREIAQHMSEISEVEEGRATATFLFPPDFIGFRGHFPDRPILPGVCEIQAVLVLLSRWKSKRVRLSAVKCAKFLAPISSDEETVIACEITQQDAVSLSVRASVSAAGSRKAQLLIEAKIED